MEAINIVLGFVGLGYLILRYARFDRKAVFFSVLNLLVVYLLFFKHESNSAQIVLVYLSSVLLCYGALRLFVRWPRFYPIAFGMPLLLLGLQKGFKETQLIGFSYLTFRLSLLAMELRQRRINVPGPFEYFQFAFFLPSFSMGPISPYSTFFQTFGKLDRSLFPLPTCFFRVLVGATKYFVFSHIVFQLTFKSLWQDGYHHGWLDFWISCVATYGYIYFNFSGFCDMAVGVAGILGIHLKENFEAPFKARNLREFWNRWHISLSEFMSDIVFTPTTMRVVRILGDKYVAVAGVAGIFLTFTLIGIWHGFEWNFLFYGLYHALGCSVVYLYSLGIKKVMGSRLSAYKSSSTIQLACWLLTFLYVSVGFFLFQNSKEVIASILRSLFL